MNICDSPNRKKLKDYFLNRLDSDETAMMQHHLMQCPACRHELGKMRRLAGDLLPEDTTVAVGDQEIPNKAVHLKLILRVAAVVGGIVLLVFGGYYFRPGKTPDIPVDTNDLPVYHAGDSIASDTKDSLATDSIRIKHSFTQDSLSHDTSNR